VQRAVGAAVVLALLACAEAPRAWGADGACAPQDPGPQDVVACVPAWDRLVARREKAAEEYPLSFALGAVHWVNVNRETGDATYGYPGAEGTFYWWASIDVKAPLHAGTERELGAHVEGRFRERTRYAPYYDGRFWLQEAYVFADVLGGRLKAGKVHGVFGLEIDGTWWGTLPYYDGFQFDPDWGVSYERDLLATSCLCLKGTAQVYFLEDRVNSSAVGGDAESDPDRDEGLSAILRLAPTWQFSGATLAVGLSGLFQEVEGAGVPDDTVLGGALDVTADVAGFTVRAAAYLVGGVRNGAHYVTGGPSERIENLVLALERGFGPVTLHVCWSAGRIHEPDGDQSLWVFGANVALLRNVDLLLEYVVWKAQADGADEVTLEDGFQVVLSWSL
jgi:hypothetical protein